MLSTMLSACPIRPQEAKYLALRNAKADMIYGHKLIIVVGQVLSHYGIRCRVVSFYR
jgi:hypothetical protein